MNLRKQHYQPIAAATIHKRSTPGVLIERLGKFLSGQGSSSQVRLQELPGSGDGEDVAERAR